MKAPGSAVTTEMIFPPSARFAPASLMKKYAALAFTSNIESYSSSAVSRIGLRSTFPTVFTATSIFPFAASASAKRRVMFSGTVRSPRKIAPVPPADSTAARVCSASAREESELTWIATFAPASAA